MRMENTIGEGDKNYGGALYFVILLLKYLGVSHAKGAGRL